MKRILSRRLISGLVTAGLVGFVAISPTPALAAGGPNLALGKSASASGTNGPYPASNVNDGNASSYWESPTNSFPQWVQIDLGSAVAIDQVKLKLPPATAWGARTQTLSVQGSTNGSSFSTLSASAGRLFDPATGNTVTIDFTAATVRYVRVNITANTGWPAAQLSELEIYGVAGGGDPDPDPDPDPPTGANLAAGKAIEASSSTFNFVAANANDGNTATYWESTGFPSTLTVHLGSDADVTGVVVKLNPDAGLGCPYAEHPGPRPRADRHRFHRRSRPGPTTASTRRTNQNTVTIPVTGRVADVQLQFFSNTGAPGGQVAEFQVLGAWAPNPDLVVTAATWTPGRAQRGHRDHPVGHGQQPGTAAAAATKVDFKLGGTVVGSADVGALAAGASATVTANVGSRAAGQLHRRGGGRPGQHGRRAEQRQQHLHRRVAAGGQPGARALTCRSSASPRTRRTRRPARRSASPSPCRTAASAPPAPTSVTRVVVGSTTLNGATPAIAAGATATVAISGTWTATAGGATVLATADATGAIAETNENNNTFSQSIVVGRGAAVPYAEYEAEAARYQGTLLEADPLRTFGHTNFATESSGRKSVRLNSTGPVRRVHLDQPDATPSWSATPSRTPRAAAARRPPSACTSTTRSCRS